MNWKHQLWMIAGSNRLGLRLIDLYARHKKIDMAMAVVGRGTDIVIEGYPRSANTSAVAAFRIAQNYKLNIAHHVHGIAQVRRACDLGLPCIVLLRDPVDSVVSLCIRDPKITLHQAIKNYIRFHRALLPLKHKVVIAEFERVLNDFDSVIEDVNSKFKTSFLVLGESVASSDIVRSKVEGMDKADNNASDVNEFTVALPSKGKHAIKEKLRGDLSALTVLRELVGISYELVDQLASDAAFKEKVTMQ